MKNLALFFFAALGTVRGGDPLRLVNRWFQIEIDPAAGAIMVLRHAGDPHGTNYVIGKAEHPEFDIDDSRWVGDVVIRYRIAGEPWRLATTSLSDEVRKIATTRPGEVSVSYTADSAGSNGLRGLRLAETYRLTGDSLVWEIRLQNPNSEPLEIGDLALPLLFNTYYVEDPVTTYTKRVVRHSLLAGDQCFVLLTRPDGAGPFLLMTPLEGSRFEYFDRVVRESRAIADPKVFAERSGFEGLYTAYLHAGVQAVETENRGTWRLPLTTRRLEPAGHKGDTAAYAFRFQWADSYDHARELLYRNGLFDIQVIPGMTVPRDLSAKIALRTNQRVEAVVPEFPAQTSVRLEGTKARTSIYELRFARLGENLVRVKYGQGREMVLEFFVTEPIETLIRKRASFIAANQQVRGTSKWYEGLFSLWDMKTQTFRNPDDVDGLHPYMVSGSDDPSLPKAPYIATKNLHFPDRREIETVEYYLEHFVWGKLQRTDQETPHPFGIYGTDSWFIHRNSPIGYGSGGNGKEHMWRTFDYTHMIQLYYNMYRVAKMYPGITRYLDANGYLDRAFGTAQAFYTVPYNIKMGKPWHFRGWCDWAYKQGNFHELYIPGLIDDLQREGRTQQADWLRGEWEKKVKYMVYDQPYPFGSEMFFDSTAFESTHAVAKYGLEHELKPDENLWQDKNTGRWYSHPRIRKEDLVTFMENEIAANVAARGWLETNFYQLGSDLRQHGNSNYLLSYMTQMGGWSILDYALYYAKDPEKYLRLGYASYLGSWALMNTGTSETNYGYWYPGKPNDGAAAWAYGPEKYFRTWAGPSQARGAWAYDGEIDSGFSGGLRTAATIVVRDPIFGDFAYGGDLKVASAAIEVVPRDGLRQRLHVLNVPGRLHIELERDGFAPEKPVVASRAGDSLRFILENRTGDSHQTTLRISGLVPGSYAVSVDGAVQSRFSTDRAGAVVTLACVKSDGCDVAIRKTSLAR